MLHTLDYEPLESRNYILIIWIIYVSNVGSTQQSFCWAPLGDRSAVSVLVSSKGTVKLQSAL